MSVKAQRSAGDEIPQEGEQPLQGLFVQRDGEEDQEEEPVTG
jgi:hypothetical protein